MTPEGGGPAPVSERGLRDLIGLAARAGCAIAGTEQVRQGVRDGKVAAVLFADDVSPTQRQKLLPLLEARGVRYAIGFSRERMGSAIGRGPTSAVGLIDEHFARRALELSAALPSLQD